jgi:hypothetical protein
LSAAGPDRPGRTVNPPGDDGGCHPDRHQLCPGRACAICRRQAVIEAVAALERSLPVAQVVVAVDAVATHPARLRILSAALATGPDVLRVGAPPVVGQLVGELIARGSTGLRAPACVSCGVTGRPLSLTDAGGMCPRCAHRHRSGACSRCGRIKPVAGRTVDGQPLCERCRRCTRGHRRCGICGNTAAIAVRSRDGHPDVCARCYQLPQAVCTACGRRRPCLFTHSQNPICQSCAPRPAARCAHCGQMRPPTAQRAEGPVCHPCYIAALRHRGTCTGCSTIRRLVAPPGPTATLCADCAGVPASHACTDCGIEDQLYERGRCARCSLHRRATQAFTGPGGEIRLSRHECGSRSGM